MLEFPRKTGTIGIIGGAGVAASAELVSRIEQTITAMGAFRDSHHPELLMYQATQTPSRSMYLEGRGESFIPGYVDAAKRLKAAGAGFVAMCCNTAHYAHGEIERKAGIPIVDLIAESLRAAIAAVPGTMRVGVLCSDGTRKCGLFDAKASALQPGLTVLYPNETHQRMVTEGICNIKKGFHRTRPSADAERPARLYGAAAADLVAQGADVVILGCTEIPLDFDASAIAVPSIDTIQVLADVCIAVSSGSRSAAR
jgi:aspartate racemase